MFDRILCQILLGFIGIILFAVIIVITGFYEQVGFFPESAKTKKEIVSSAVIFFILVGGLLAFFIYDIFY